MCQPPTTFSPSRTHRRSPRTVARFLSVDDGGFDVFLTPTLSEPPALIGEITSTEEEPLRALERGGRTVAYAGRGCEHHRQPGDVRPTVVERRRPADRRALPRPLRRRGDAVPARRATRGRAAVGRPAPVCSLAAPGFVAAPSGLDPPAVQAPWESPVATRSTVRRDARSPHLLAALLLLPVLFGLLPSVARRQRQRRRSRRECGHRDAGYATDLPCRLDRCTAAAKACSSRLDQRSGQAAPEEPGATGDENPRHGASVPPLARFAASGPL